MDRSADRVSVNALRGLFLAVRQVSGLSGVIRTDRRCVVWGRALLAAHCAAHHDPASRRTIIGPGLQDVLKNPKLPVSGHPATVESIRFQLRQPMKGMPSFSYLSDDEMSDLIAYLNTL